MRISGSSFSFSARSASVCCICFSRALRSLPLNIPVVSEEFSKQLHIEKLYNYIVEVDRSTTEILKTLTYEDSRKKISDEKRHKVERLNVVSTDENAYWLIDYWCGKDVRGLIQMPLSRHWIMHIEACLRIRDRIKCIV